MNAPLQRYRTGRIIILCATPPPPLSATSFLGWPEIVLEKSISMSYFVFSCCPYSLPLYIARKADEKRTQGAVYSHTHKQTIRLTTWNKIKKEEVDCLLLGNYRSGDRYPFVLHIDCPPYPEAIKTSNTTSKQKTNLTCACLKINYSNKFLSLCVATNDKYLIIKK